MIPVFFRCYLATGIVEAFGLGAARDSRNTFDAVVVICGYVPGGLTQENPKFTGNIPGMNA